MGKENIVFCRSGGCTAKLGAGMLEHILSKIPKKEDDNLLIGFDHADDAAVYRISEDLAIVQTLDFFPPMVEDPYTFGQIAAANALSDIYAMGGTVKTALNIVCFPEQMDLNILGEILLGGNSKVTEAGGTLAGGHSIADTDVKYGMSVMGTVHPDKVLANNGVRDGDVLLLTKPLGVGIVLAASQMKDASGEAYSQAVRSMTTLNKYAAEVLSGYEVHGCTDVTGFGFLKHLSEMLGEDHSAEIDSDAVPFIEDADRYAEEFYLTAAGQRNRNAVGSDVEFLNVPFWMEEILFDPQTSGGLLAGVRPEDAQSIMKELNELELPCAIVGRITKRSGKKITVSWTKGA
ncbi:MAG: selenide, water dikinase SelD [Anaerostipes sp.]|nr:selenide, water dikinase SelD [Anaerostipes sp.]MBS7009735.1 selenide, water dikinase SelD [Anaerostipes sp.]